MIQFLKHSIGEFCYFGHSNLFRISDFVLRIYETPQHFYPVKFYVHYANPNASSNFLGEIICFFHQFSLFSTSKATPINSVK